MGTATYCICEEPNCLFVQDPFFGKLFSLKEKKTILFASNERRSDCCIRDGQGTRFTAIPCPADRGPGHNTSELQSTASIKEEREWLMS